jgi:hypothetical protein
VAPTIPWTAPALRRCQGRGYEAASSAKAGIQSISVMAAQTAGEPWSEEISSQLDGGISVFLSTFFCRPLSATIEILASVLVP